MIAGKVAVILQARIGSTRLPGKVLEPINDSSLLAHAVVRLRAAGAGPVMVATTTLDADDAVVAEARRLEVSVYRGESDDVLARFMGAADMLGAEFVVRATADNPAVDPASVTRLVDRVRGTFADHAVEDGLPCGCTAEVVRTTALRDAARRATDPADREHVTTFIRRAGSGFKCSIARPPLSVRRPDLRFTVDTQADLEYMRRVLTDVDLDAGAVVPLPVLIAVADGLDRRVEVA